MPEIAEPVVLGFRDLDEYEPDEQMGSKTKHWVRFEGHRWLVKIARVEPDGRTSGEDWAEWLVPQLATLLAVPTATVRLATFEGERAAMSRSVVAAEWERLIHGNELLSISSDYDPNIRGENPGYSVVAVRDALDKVSPPSSVREPQGFSAYDAWAGFLVLDAWVAGRDRHHENWAVIRDGGHLRLAPSFDHGNALGFQESDVARTRMLDDDGRLQRWVSKGRSHHFAGRPVLTELAHDAVALASRGARERWLQRLEAIDFHDVRDAVSSLPDDVMSEVARTFALRILEVNRRRLIDGYPTSLP